MILSLTIPASAMSAQPESYDVIVYGGTSAAITAAIQVKQMGKSVLLLSPDKRLGGLTTGGLGWTDLGDSRTVGGLSREFYNRVYLHYSEPSAWRWQKLEEYGNEGQNSKSRDDQAQVMVVFEPSATEKVFNDWLEQNEVKVEHARLDLNLGVLKRANKIVGLRTESGHLYSAQVFIDATYEGDLMAHAGVSFTTGREANSQYNETFNGIQVEHAKQNQLPKGISPYIKENDPKSGLLPGVEPNDGKEDGTADHRIQAYCYRMCLTNVPENRVDIQKPKNYKESDYEILFRAIDEGQHDRFFKFSPIPNHKTDSNNDSGISTDFIGMNYDYPNADYKAREQIAKRHEDWQMGLLWSLQHSKRVPEKLRKIYLDWGLPKDEYTDNHNWSTQLYIREARRMVSDYVITERTIRDKSSVDQSIGMGSYQMDSHNVRRMVGPDGYLMDEGDVQKSPDGPYQIDYGCIVPKESECTNLLVPVCVSSSHIAFGSIRMEPVFMILGQSAGTAAVLALDKQVPVQQVVYTNLKDILEKDGQVLHLK